MEKIKGQVEAYIPRLYKVIITMGSFIKSFKALLSIRNVILVYIFYMLVFLIVMYVKNDDLTVGICFSESCLAKLSDKYENFISLTQWLVTTMAIIIAARSLKLSQASFEQSKANNQFNNHISNKKFFSENVIAEIKESSYISRATVDVNKFYHFMFPLSSQGSFDLHDKYEKSLLLLKKYLIQTSNNAKKATAFDFKKHQAKVAKILKDFGIDLVYLPRRDFNLVEQEIFQLIDSVTILMTSFDKKYLLSEVDIHYR